jgi:hypothetical protein
MDGSLKNKDPELVRALPKAVCNIAEKLWFVRKSEHAYPGVYEGYDIHDLRSYGLSDYADHSSHNSDGIYSNAFIWFLFRENFILVLDWSIRFVNEVIKAYATYKLGNVEEVEVFFSSTNSKKKYYGNQPMWMAGVIEHNVPHVVGDIIYILKTTVINSIDSDMKDKEYVTKLAD